LERLHKIIARAGLASLREAERWILQGQVRVNGSTVRRLGVRADPNRDRIEVNGRLIGGEAACRYFLFHKPAGVITSMRDPESRPDLRSWREGSAGGKRLFPVGRLDFNSQGLLILTNDGELAFRLTHPRYEVQKTYQVKVRGIPSQAELNRLQKGMRLGDGMTAPAEATILKVLAEKAWIQVRIHEGRNREVRRMLEALGHPVERLIRTELGPVRLGSLQPGEFRPLSFREIRELKRITGLTGARSPGGRNRSSERAAPEKEASLRSGLKPRLQRRSVRKLDKSL
jgi:23S rRNA pseudouridine2605 synthase